jgi:prepilin-type N-terminal cleavage/methylation domain-containing protein
MGKHAAGHLSEEDGMSLVEVMVGMLVLGVVLSALASTSIASMRSIVGSERRVHAVQLGNEAVEQLQVLPWERLGLRAADTPGSTFEGLPVVTVADHAAVPQHQRTVTRGGIDYLVTTVVTRVTTAANGAELRGLVVIVSWDGGQRSVRAETRRASP